MNKLLGALFPSNKKSIDFKEYSDFNQHTSSEMFYSIMRVLHNQMPCTANFFRLRRKYRLKFKSSLEPEQEGTNAFVKLASPRFVRGLNINLAASNTLSSA